MEKRWPNVKCVLATADDLQQDQHNETPFILR